MFEPIRQGGIEVITGGMFSGKTEELLRRLRRLEIAGRAFQVFKPSLDTRSGTDEVVSHIQGKFPALVVPSDAPERLHALMQPTTEVVVVDEAQFFARGLIQVADQMATAGKRVIVAGLDLDFRGRPFGPIPGLMAVAERVDKLQAVCTECGALACRTQRLVEDDAEVLVGAETEYAARCRACYKPPKEDR